MEILIVTGLSGAGKSSVASGLEDIGYYTVDNVPPEFIPKLAEFCAMGGGRYDHVAIVSDIRTAGGNFNELLSALHRLKQSGIVCRLVFLSAASETIIKRYKETRRRHPLMDGGATIEDAVHREEEMLRPLREQADVFLDTTNLTGNQLRTEIFHLFQTGFPEGQLHVSVVSFGYRYGIPLEADLVFDVRFLPNPFYVPELRELSGMDEPVYQYVMQSEKTQDFLRRLNDMVSFLLPLYEAEGKTMLVVGIGCTGGRHRSVSVARALAEVLRESRYPIYENHRDIYRK